MNNKEKNTFVKKQITTAMLDLLSQYEFSNISISQVTETAQVSRNSFYRNYTDKEDVLLQYCRCILISWNDDYKAKSSDSNAELYGSLFQHIKENKDFYTLLKKRNLFHIILTILLELTGPRPEHENMWAYTTAFISYGTYGWIEEWIDRGMQESAEMMVTMLSANGMK